MLSKHTDCLACFRAVLVIAAEQSYRHLANTTGNLRPTAKIGFVFGPFLILPPGLQDVSSTGLPPVCSKLTESIGIGGRYSTMNMRPFAHQGHAVLRAGSASDTAGSTAGVASGHSGADSLSTSARQAATFSCRVLPVNLGVLDNVDVPGLTFLTAKPSLHQREDEL